MDPQLIWAIVLLLAGIGFLIAELFFPSAGLLSFLAAVTLIASIFVAFQSGPFVGLIVLVVIVVGGPILIVTGLKIWPNTPIGRRIMLSVPESEGAEVEDEHQVYLKSLIGQVGRARCEMLPGGLISVDGRTIDAVSQGMVVEKGQMVRIISAQTNCVTVRPLEEGETQASASDVSPADDMLQRPVDTILDADPFDSDGGGTGS